jgi:hypothetical protein
VIVFTPIISKTARCYHFTKKLEGESRRSARSQPERSPLGLTVPPALLVRADEVIKNRCLLRCMIPEVAHRVS